MQVDPVQRSVRLSVRELAIFRNQPMELGYGYSPWRASVGQSWHQTTAEETLGTNPDARIEQSVEIKWRHREWNFHLSGRIDQLIPQEDGFLIREVKTIRKLLPSEVETLVESYKDHFSQVSIYRQILGALPEYAGKKISAEILFINIENGARQSVRLSERELALAEGQLDAIYPFLEERRSSHLRVCKAQLKPAFEELREGQAELFSTLAEAALKSQVVLMEAPTGFGKTGIALEHALTHMQRGLYERCIYLSSKSTGQIQTIEQLKRMSHSELRYLQMRNRVEHRIDSARHSCTGDERCNEGIGQLWREADLHPAGFFKDGTFDLEASKALGASTGICPYSLTKVCLPYAEVWIGDSNYIFSPESQSVFMDAQGFDPARTLLIVDEAHNLPERTADSLSVEVSAGELLFAIEELRAHGAPRRLLSVAQEICRWIDGLKPEQALNTSELYGGLDLCEDFTRLLSEAHFDYASTARFALDLAWQIPRLAERLSAPADEYLTWVPTAGRLRASCLDASDWIGHCLQPFGGAILMSATLQPLEDFRLRSGISASKSTFALGAAPWRETAYQVAIDQRVDTRLRTRDRFYETTGQTVGSCIQASPGQPIIVFFSSYLYAENVKTYTEALYPQMRITQQPRGVDLKAQTDFIEESLLCSDAIFLILGSSYAEGIDLLGGRVGLIMIVGPALPEVNLIQKTKMEQHPGQTQDQAFRDVYLRPAMRRIHQALGRIVRAPGQKARVLLHGRRFAEMAYRDEIAPEYQTEKHIRCEQELIQWLEQS